VKKGRIKVSAEAEANYLADVALAARFGAASSVLRFPAVIRTPGQAADTSAA